MRYLHTNPDMAIKHVITIAALAIASACTVETPKEADTVVVPSAPAPSTTTVTDTTGLASAPAQAPASAPSPKPGGDMVVTVHGIGPLRAGMTIAEAKAAVGSSLVVAKGTDTTACGYLQWKDGPPGVTVMIEQARIARIDVQRGSIATDAGARIGDTEAAIQKLYPGQVAITPHKYTDGHYLTVTPPAAADKDFRLVFETDKGKVTRYRAGRLPSVGYVEGCS